MTIKRNFNKTPDLNALTYGRVPPQATEAEEAVLGVLLLEKGRITEVQSIIPKDECFYADAHQKIYAAILRLAEKGVQVDMLTVTDELNKSKELEAVGGAYKLAQMTMNVVSSAHVETHARIVMEKYMLREAIRISGQIISDAYNDVDPFDLQEKFVVEMNSVYEAKSGSGWSHISQVAKDFLQEREDRNSGKAGTVISTTFPYVDSINIGFKPTNFIIIAARPAMGKSAIVLPMITETARVHGAVGIINLEMGNTQSFGRIVSHKSGVGYTDLEQGYNISDTKLIEYVGELSKLPVYFSTVHHMNINNIVAAGSWLKKKFDCKLIAIDYLQLIESASKSGNREQEVSKISRGLKMMAMSLNIPVIALGQLNRDCEKRPDKKPMLADLRESGSLEQDADIVMLLHRDWQAGIEQDAQGQSTENEADLIFAKWRNGRTGTVKLNFHGATMKFSENRTEPVYDNPRAGITPQGFKQHIPFNND